MHKSIFIQFIESFCKQAEKLSPGDPLDLKTDISSMIDEENAIRVEQWINEAVSNCARVVFGGKRKGAYVEPTVITNSKREMKVCSQEVFGPVVVIESFESFKDAINEINSSEYGLQAGVFTNWLDEQNYAFNELKVGGVIINDVPTFRVDHMPYGGIKNSGFGREGVKYAMLDMLEPKLLIQNFK